MYQAMKLRDWLDLVDKRPRWLAEQIGVTETAARRYVNGDRTPRGEKMRAIMALTKGAVTANDFLDAADEAERGKGGPQIAAA